MAERIKVRNLRGGMKTAAYRILDDARVNEEAGTVSAPVRYHDGGDDVRRWDHPDIEIEIE